jgi:hypothetical protein
MKVELIEEQFERLQQNNPTVKYAMDFGRAYGLDREHTLMLAIQHLATVNENLKDLKVKELQLSPVPVTLEQSSK